jgi:6-phosphogluconolactonase
MPEPLTVPIGTYVASGGAGVVPLTIAPDGTLSAGEPYRSARNASFAVCAAGSGLLYLVDEEAGMIGVHRRDGAHWRELARVPSGGSAPCYLSLDREERFLAVANYDSGHVALFELDEYGLPQEPPGLFRAPGQGPVAERQEGPHAHCVRFAPDNSSLYMVDLGADRVMRLALEGGGLGEGSQAWRAPAGSGPRHLLFHPQLPLAVLLSELASTLTLLGLRDDGTLRPIQVVSTLPTDFTGESLGGHLEFDGVGRRIYVSNRGHNSIALFELEIDGRSNGRLNSVCHVPSGGDHPRHFRLIDSADQGDLLIVAHEQDDHVGIFSLADNGRPRPLGNGIRIDGACCVLC